MWVKKYIYIDAIEISWGWEVPDDKLNVAFEGCSLLRAFSISTRTNRPMIRSDLSESAVSKDDEIGNEILNV
jgi:hypothetical protein